MLTSVPTAIMRSARIVTLRHPNSFPVTVHRKTLLREEIDPATGLPGVSAGQPTMGGMGVLRSEDEAEIQYIELGEGRMIFAGPGPYQPHDIIERDNGLLVENSREVTLESLAEEGETGHFIADTGDLVMVDLGMGVIQAWEVVTTTGTVHIPPYTRKLVLNPRDDLSYMEPFEE